MKMMMNYTKMDMEEMEEQIEPLTNTLNMETEDNHLRSLLEKLDILTTDVRKMADATQKEWEDNNRVDLTAEKDESSFDLDELKRHKSENSLVRLNVDGVVFLSCWTEMARYPESRLAKLGEANSIEDIRQLCDNYSAKDNEFYFRKRNKNFGEILEFYRSGSLHISDDSCVVAFGQDLQYWGISASFLEVCCSNRLSEAREALELHDEYLDKTVSSDEQFPPGRKGQIQKYLWDLFEYPHSSLGAQLVAAVSVTAIMLSIIILTLGSLPQFEDHEDQILGDYFVFAIMEAVYISWFTLEFLVRLICCPNKVVFVKQVMNWIDLLAILPYFITLGVYYLILSGQDENSTSSDSVLDTHVWKLPQVFRLLRILKILRFIARFFKLARHSIGMQALGYTIKSNYRELSLVLLFLGMGAIIFASIAFVFEGDADNSMMETMLDGYWWAVITMTTVGYGDISPVTRMGKLIGTLCAVFGVLVVALPVPIIGNSFVDFYDREKKRQKKIADKMRREKAGSSLYLVSHNGEVENNDGLRKENEDVKNGPRGIVVAPVRHKE